MDRLLALSDGVVAIAITLLVLQLNVPSSAKFLHPDSASELAAQLSKGAGQLVGYVISFYVVAQFWLVHHRVFRRITGHQEGLAWWNFAFLFTITIMPFTSDLLGEFSANPLAVDIFAANLLLAAVATELTTIYSRRKDLVTAETAQETRAAHFRAAASVFVIALSMGIAWVNPEAAKYCWLLLAVAPRIADRWSGRQSALTQLASRWMSWPWPVRVTRGERGRDRNLPASSDDVVSIAPAEFAAERTPTTPENHFSAVAADAYDPSVVTGMPTWREVRTLISRELGEQVSDARPLTPPRMVQMTWAARAQATGPVVVKVRHGDRAYEKTQWCAAHLPALGARGYPVPAILWHGMISAQWHLTVQNRLPGCPLFAPGVALDGPMLDALLRLVELQAGAGIPAGDRDFTGYVANVLFDDWDNVWADAARACAAAGPLCARLRRWLEPVWGLRLPPADYAHNDLNLSNVLTDETQITGVVDWDEFGLGSRSLDLVALALDCEQCGDRAAAGRLLARAAQVAGGDGLRCLVSYRVIGGLAVFTRERQAYGSSLGDEECAAGSAILDRLQVTGSA